MYIDQIKTIEKKINERKNVIHNRSLTNFQRITYINTRPNPDNSYYYNYKSTFNLDDIYSQESTVDGIIGVFDKLYEKDIETNGEKFFIDIRDKYINNLSAQLILSYVKNIGTKNTIIDRNIHDFLSRYGSVNTQYRDSIIFGDDISTIVDRENNTKQMIVYMFDKIELNIKDIDFIKTKNCYKAIVYQDFRVINPKILYIINDSESDNYKLYKQFLRDNKIDNLLKKALE